MTVREDAFMQRIDGRMVYSASDLNNFLECRHLEELERRVALGDLVRPEADAAVELLARKGDEHETHHLERLRRAYGDRLIAFDGPAQRSIEALERAERQTFDAMAGGAQIIYQAAFFDGEFVGRADFLRRVERPSACWPWSYEVIDTKLALTPKPYYLIQLCNYSEHLARLQGAEPLDAYVVLGSGEERRFRVDDYLAYYRRTKSSFLAQMAQAPNATYPFETGHCAVCSWNATCARQRDRDDHLSIVAGIRKDQIGKLELAGVPTLAALADAGDDRRPHGMQESTFRKLRAQAALQHVQRTQRRHVYELLDAAEGSGFELLPPADEGDVFFDMEGDPLYSPERGLEYLFGLYLPQNDEYRPFWARSERDERAAFQACIDSIVERRSRYPQMHVYHYAPYETTALRRLMGYYGTRERELDDLLRGEVFIDLYAVVRQALRVSQPSYSIKKLEAFYGMERSTNVRRGDDSIVMFESWLVSNDASILHDIERYNDDDCRSTYLLRQWLLERRAERERSSGQTLAWRAIRERETPEDRERSELAQQLLDGIPAPASLRELRQAAEPLRERWLLGYLLDYHAREAKPAYWKLYDRFENVDRLAEFDSEAIAGLRIRTDVPPYKLKERDRSLVYTYDFPEQAHNLGTDTPVCPDSRASAGQIVAIDDEAHTLKIKLSKAIRPDALRALIPGKPVNTKEQQGALSRLAESSIDGTMHEKFPAATSILLSRPPRFTFERRVVQPHDITAGAVSDVVRTLDRSHLVIQGPPGTGKSTIGASFVVDLLAEGRRVGILANGHKAIHNLLAKIESCARERAVSFRGFQKFSTTNEGSTYQSPLTEPLVVPVPDVAAFSAPHDLAAGTSWLFSRPEMEAAYDYLVIDEAGQMSLADALACSLSAGNVVLLGDPLQLAQVSQGSHPLGTDLSVLEHLLDGRDTVDPRTGVFLETSYRMAPSICEFISRTVYDGRLQPARECVGNAVYSPGISGSGLRWIAVRHEGNSRASSEEAASIVDAIVRLLQGSVELCGAPRRAVRPADIMVVSPYNAQRKFLRKRLEDAGLGDVRVGTVDKFQGQEAPIVFYSMATSSGTNLPRDLSFLFEKNRLNVAISRAQVLSVLVCSPDLLEIRCSTPEQMALVNLLCGFVENAARQAESLPLH